jgi:cholesterol transport system auxiliary component
MKINRWQLHPIYPLFFALFLSACSILPTTKLVHIYKLPTTTNDNKPQTAKLNWSLRINTPHASQQLDSVRIVVIPTGNQINSYQGVRWSERAPILLRDRILDTFQRNDRINIITSDNTSFNVDAELTSDLHAFQSEYHNGKPEVRIQIDMYLVENKNQRVLASHRFDVLIASKNADIESVMQAFGLASDNLSHEIEAWTQTALVKSKEL